MFSVPNPLAWHQLNTKWQQQAAIDEGIGVRVYPGAAQALFEVVIGTALFFNHKRSIGFVGGNSWLTLQTSSFFYKEAYKVQVGKPDQTTDWTAWVSTLEADTVGVVWCADHPVTGEIFEGMQALDEALNKRKIYSFQINHSTRWSGQELAPYSVRLIDAGDYFSWIEFGKRFRTPPVVAQHMAGIQLPDAEAALTEKRLSFSENSQVVSDFENKNLGGFHPFLKTELRIFDRAVIYSPLVHGGLLIHELSQRFPAAGALLNSTNLCVDSKFDYFRDWWTPVPAKDVLRGLVVIGHQLLALPGFNDSFVESVHACQTNFALKS